MKLTFVCATANSRLHGDVMILRLRRAGINIDSVSAIFPTGYGPHLSFYRLRYPQAMWSRAAGKAFFVVGPLRRLFDENDDVETVPNTLHLLGIERHAAELLGEPLTRGQGLICVQAKYYDAAAIAWHIFEHSKAKNIAISGQPAVAPTVEPAEVSLASDWAPAFAA